MRSRVADLYVCRRVQRSTQSLFVCVWKPGRELCSENLGIKRDLTVVNPAGERLGGGTGWATLRPLGGDAGVPLPPHSRNLYSEQRRFPDVLVGAMTQTIHTHTHHVPATVIQQVHRCFLLSVFGGQCFVGQHHLGSSFFRGNIDLWDLTGEGCGWGGRGEAGREFVKDAWTQKWVIDNMQT